MRVLVSIGFLPILVICLLPATLIAADEFRIEPLDEAAPVNELPDSVASRLSDTGYTLLHGESRRLLQIWLCKKWKVEPGFEPSSELLYPFQQGQLIGVVRFRRSSREFRDQEIERGVYTMRYAQQPVDGNHEGTSPTRDFVLLIRAEDDPEVDDLDVEDLQQISADAAFSNHPAMFCLQKPSLDAEVPSVRHEERRDWWIANLAGVADSGESEEPLRIDMVVIGFADE